MVKFETQCSEAEIRQLLALLQTAGEIPGKPLVSNRQSCRATFAATALNPHLTGRAAAGQVTLTWTRNTGMVHAQSSANLLEEMESRARELDGFFHVNRLLESTDAHERMTEYLAQPFTTASDSFSDDIYVHCIGQVAGFASEVL